MLLVCDDVAAVADLCGSGAAALALLSALAHAPSDARAAAEGEAPSPGSSGVAAPLPPLPAAAPLRTLLRLARGTDLALRARSSSGGGDAGMAAVASLHGCLRRLADAEWLLEDLPSGRGGGVHGRLRAARWPPLRACASEPATDGSAAPAAAAAPPEETEGGGNWGDDSVATLYCVTSDAAGVRLL